MPTTEHTNNSPPRLRLRVTATAETILRSGHPWLYEGSIREQNRDGSPGELAVVFDRKDRFLAIGLYDPDSPLRVRVLHAGKPQTIDREWWQARLAQAIEKRRGLFDAQTTGHRWINGESDGWPGLVLDRYDTTLVLKLYTAAWLPRLEEVASLIDEALPNDRLVLRLSRNIQAAAGALGLEDGMLTDKSAGNRDDAGALPPFAKAPPSAPAVVFLESGLRFEAGVVRGQKTGFFLDQRENRRRVESLACGRDVLNAFSFTGGFSLYAARGGATSVVSLDLSAHALAGAERNFALNQSDPAVAACRHETIQADAFTWLERPPQRQFDIVILDPPSLAKREDERQGAIQAYSRLGVSGIKHMRQGGVLVASSCSAHVTADEFWEAMRGAALESRRTFRELLTTGHAPDHPAAFPEAQYLKSIQIAFEPRGA